MEITPFQLNTQIVPALQQISELALPQRVALAVKRNINNAEKVLRKADDARMERLKQHCHINEDGRIKVIMTPQGPGPDFITPESQATFQQWNKEFEATTVYRINAHQVDVAGLGNTVLPPKLLKLLEFMFIDKDQDTSDAELVRPKAPAAVAPEAPEVLKAPMEVVREEETPTFDQQPPPADGQPVQQSITAESTPE